MIIFEKFKLSTCRYPKRKNEKDSYIFLSGIIFILMGADMFKGVWSINVSDYRLSENILPLHYTINIVLHIDLYQIEFGECAIDIEIKEATYTISLHSLNMEIHEYWTVLVNKYGMKVQPINHKVNSTMQILSVEFSNKIPSGLYTLYIKYVPFFTPYIEKEAGFVFINFPVKEMNVTFINDGYLPRKMFKANLRPRMLFATNIQSIKARQVFPCWDEPHYVTSFQINVNHHVEWKVLSNVPATRTGTDLLDKDWLWTEFHIANNTISTRDVAIAITDALESSTHITLNNVWSRFYFEAPEMQFGNEVMQKISDLPIFAVEIFPTNESANESANANESIQKIIVPCIKHDFIGKLGLVIYKEELFIHDIETDTIAHKMEVARTIVRGMIHYQLDNTVPRFWWSQQWFNEGHFIFLQIEILDKIFPGWQPLDLFVVQFQHESLHLDTGFYMRPLSHLDNTPFEIQSLFSYPFYVKAPAMLRMLQHVIGLEKFKQIMKLCLTKSLSSYDILWSVIQLNLDNSKLHNYTIKDMMDGWTSRSNYPIVEVIRLRGNNTVLIKPYYYYLIGDISLYNVHNRLIPITFTTQKQIDFLNTKPIQWLIPQYQENITISLNKTDWIIVNLQQTGYYRVKYDYKNWELIANYLNSTEYKNIHVINRAQLIDDAYYFWMAHQLNYNIFKKVTGYLQQETDFVAWYPMFQVFKYISQFLPLEEIKPLQDHMLYILSMLHNELNYTESSNETDLIKCLRQEAARWACTFGDSKCQTFVTALLQNHLKDPIKHKLLPGWKDWIYCKSLWNVKNHIEIFDDWLIEDLHGARIFNYVPCAKMLIDRNVSYNVLLYIRNILESKTIKNIYIPYYFVARHANKNIDNITTNFRKYNNIIPDKVKLLSIIINNLYTDYQINKIKQFIQDELIDNIKNDMQNILYTINRRLYQIKNQKDKLIKLLEIWL